MKSLFVFTLLFMSSIGFSATDLLQGQDKHEGMNLVSSEGSDCTEGNHKSSNIETEVEKALKGSTRN